MNSNLKTLERQTAAELAGSLTSNPEAWRWTDADCDIVRGPGGIGMSATYFVIYSPVKVRFGFWNRRRIRRAFKRWRAVAGDNLANSEHHRALVALLDCLGGERLREVA